MKKVKKLNDLTPSQQKKFLKLLKRLSEMEGVKLIPVERD